MPSREEIADWLRYGADEILNPYRPIPKKTRIAIGVQQIIDKIKDCATQVENMRCENCNKVSDCVAYLVMGQDAKDFGCFSYETKED